MDFSLASTASEIAFTYAAAMSVLYFSILSLMAAISSCMPAYCSRVANVALAQSLLDLISLSIYVSRSVIFLLSSESAFFKFSSSFSRMSINPCSDSSTDFRVSRDARIAVICLSIVDMAVPSMVSMRSSRSEIAFSIFPHPVRIITTVAKMYNFFISDNMHPAPKCNRVKNAESVALKPI